MKFLIVFTTLFLGIVFGDQITVVGRSNLLINSDTANITFSVISSDKSIEKALQKNRNSMSDLVKAIKKIGINDISTNYYQLRKEQDNVPSSPYVIENSITITINDLNNIAKTIDTALKNGSNRFYNLYFYAKDEQKAYKQAKELAFKQAKESAYELARLADKKITKIVNIEEYSQLPTQLLGSAIFPRQSQIGASIKVTFEME